MVVVSHLSRSWRRRACVVALVMSSSVSSFAATFEATVSRVVDGDTVWVRAVAGVASAVASEVGSDVAGAAASRRPKLIKLRLQGIDAPERCQAWGAQATAALEARVLHQRVQVQMRAKDDHQRALGNLLLNGEDVSAWMVTEGHAWSYHFRRSSGPYAEPEQQARAARRGLFADPAATEPRWFRRDHGPCL